MAEHRHKRETNARKFRVRVPKAPFVAAPLALVATLSTVGAGVLVASPETQDLLASSSSTTTSSGSQSLGAAVDLSDRAPVVSRSGSRIEPLSEIEKMLTAQATAKAIRRADTQLWTTTTLNVWTTPQEATAEKLGELDAGKKVLITGRTAAGRIEIVLDGKSRWVTSGYLSDEKPDASPPALGGTCTNGTSVPSGVSPNITAVHQAVCANFPEITTYGTLRDDGEHSQGIAVDIMVSGARGREVADFVRANFSDLGVNYVIHAQQIWSVDRSSEGWRYMEDRGSVTANHYDHVHVTTY